MIQALWFSTRVSIFGNSINVGVASVNYTKFIEFGAYLGY